MYQIWPFLTDMEQSAQLLPSSLLDTLWQQSITLRELHVRIDTWRLAAIEAWAPLLVQWSIIPIVLIQYSSTANRAGNGMKRKEKKRREKNRRKTRKRMRKGDNNNNNCNSWHKNSTPSSSFLNVRCKRTNKTPVVCCTLTKKSSGHAWLDRD